MAVRPPPDGEVLKTTHVTGSVFIPGAKKGSGAIRGRYKQRVDDLGLVPLEGE